jgi:hypothetical protein
MNADALGESGVNLTDGWCSVSYANLSMVSLEGHPSKNLGLALEGLYRLCIACMYFGFLESTTLFAKRTRRKWVHIDRCRES